MAQKLIKRKSATHGRIIQLKGLLDKVKLVEKPFIRNDFPVFRAGDTIRVHVKIKEGEKERVQVYEGLVVSRSNHGTGRSFIVRKISHGYGVERIFLESSPKIAKIEKVQTGKVRRAKLYYVRELQGKAARIERELDVTGSKAATSSAPKPVAQTVTQTTDQPVVPKAKKKEKTAKQAAK